MTKLRENLVWRDKKERVVLKNMVVGHFAMWSTRQSPYMAPENLYSGIQEFTTNLGISDFFKGTIEDLGDLIWEAIELSPAVVGWNAPKKGNHEIVFSSRYDTPQADYDFIDLHALARNIKHSVWLELMYDDNEVLNG